MPVFGSDPRKFGRNKDIDLLALTEYDFPTHARIDVRAALAAKEAATGCHASQAGPMQMRGGGILSLIMRGQAGNESYMRAYPPTNGNHHVAKDLFEGI